MKRSLALLAVLLLAFGLAAHGQTASATVGTAFSYQITPANPPYGVQVSFQNGTSASVTETSGFGLSYSPATGQLSGTPTAAGIYTIAVYENGININNVLTLTVSASGTNAVPPVARLFCATDTNPACGVVLTWAAPPAPIDPTLAVTGYLIFRGVSGSGTTTQITAKPVTGTAYTDNTIAASTTYVYDAVSIDAAGTQSLPSNQVTVVVADAPSVPTPATPENLTGSVVN